MLTNLLSTTGKTVLASLIISANLFANPTNPTKPSSFDASVFVTKTNKIRVAIEKKNPAPVSITLRQSNQSNQIVFSQTMGKKQSRLALQLDVDQLEDGVYDLEIHSSSGTIIKQVNLITPTKTALERTVTIP